MRRSPTAISAGYATTIRSCCRRTERKVAATDVWPKSVTLLSDSKRTADDVMAVRSLTGDGRSSCWVASPEPRSIFRWVGSIHVCLRDGFAAADDAQADVLAGRRAPPRVVLAAR